MRVLPLLINSTLMAQEAKVTPLMSKGLAEFPGKEGLMITVEYPPGCADPCGQVLPEEDSIEEKIK